MTRVLIILLLFASLQGCKDSVINGQVTIQWVKNLQGDFSFCKNWSYPEGIYRNSFGQLSCDGICPERIQKMQDNKGKIFNDSIKAFYSLVDTTHQYYTIQCEAQTYEWAGCNSIYATREPGDSIKCFTQTNAGTHSILQLLIYKSICIPTIMLISISGGQFIYQCSDGSITLEKEAFDQGLLKAVFDFNFIDTEDQKTKMFWKGKIITRIK